jgi:hypothetical protein
LQWAEWKARQPKDPTPVQVTTPEVKAATEAVEEAPTTPVQVTTPEELVTPPKAEPEPGAVSPDKLMPGASQEPKHWYADLLREPKPAKLKDVGEEVTVYAGREMKEFPVRPATVDIDELVVSAQPGTFQNRDLKLTIEQDKINKISANPKRDHLENVAVGADRGAPIVWIDPETKLAYVVSGNGRVLAMRQSGKFQGGIKVRVLQGDQPLAEALVPLGQETTAGIQTPLTKARGTAKKYKLTDKHLPVSVFKGPITENNIGRFLDDNKALAGAIKNLPENKAEAARIVREALAGMLPEKVQALAETLGEVGAQMFMDAAPGLLALKQLAKTNKRLARFDVLEDFVRAAKFLKGSGGKKLTNTQMNRLLEKLATETDMFEGAARNALGGLNAPDIAHIIGLNAIRGRKNPGKALMEELERLYRVATGAQTKGFSFSPDAEEVYRQLWKAKIGNRAEAIAEKLKGVVEGPKPKPKPKPVKPPAAKKLKPAAELGNRALFREAVSLEKAVLDESGEVVGKLGPRYDEVAKELGARGKKAFLEELRRATKKGGALEKDPHRAALYARYAELYADEVFFGRLAPGVAERHGKGLGRRALHSLNLQDEVGEVAGNIQTLADYDKLDNQIRIFAGEEPATFVHEMTHAAWSNMLTASERLLIKSHVPKDFHPGRWPDDPFRRANEYFAEVSEAYLLRNVEPSGEIARLVKKLWGKVSDFAKWVKQEPRLKELVKVNPEVEALLLKVAPGMAKRPARVAATAPRVKPHVRSPGEIKAGVKPGPYKPPPSVGAGPGAGRPVKTVQAIGESIQKATGVALKLGTLSKKWASKGAHAVYEGFRGLATLEDTRAAAKAMREAKKALPDVEKRIKRAIGEETKKRQRVKWLKDKVAKLRKAEHREVDAARVERELNAAGRELTKAREAVKKVRAEHGKLTKTIKEKTRDAKLYSTRQSSRRLLAMVHESGHHLSKAKKIGADLAQAELDELRFIAIEAYDPEVLAGLSKAEMADESLAEAFAQFVVNDDLTMYSASLRKKLTDMFQKVDGVDDIKGSVRDYLKANADELYEAYRGQFTRSFSDILESKGGIRGVASRVVRGLKTALLDKYAPIEHIFKAVGADPTALKIMRFVEGTSSSRAHHFIQHGVLRTATGKEVVVKGLQGIKKDLGGAGELDELISYIHNKRSTQLRKEGFKVKDEKLVAEEIVRKFEAKADPKWKKAADDYLEWNDAALNYGREAGLINDKSYEAMRWMDAEKKTERRFYIPFHKDLAASGRRGGGGTTSNPFRHRLKGSETGQYKERLTDLMEHTEKIIKASDRAMVTKHLVSALESVPGLGRFLRPVGPATQVAPGVSYGAASKRVKDFMEDMEKSLRSQGYTTANAINDDVKTLMLNIEALQGHVRPDVVTLYHKGQLMAYEMTPELASAFRSVPVQMEGSVALFFDNVAKAARFPARAVRAGAVELNPAFMFLNAIRDGFTVVSKEGLEGVKMLARGYGKTIKLRLTGKEHWSAYNKTLMEAFDAAGLSSSGFSGSTVRHSKAAYRKLMNDSLWRKANNVVGSYREFLATTELAPRIGAFESKLRKMGWRGDDISPAMFIEAAEAASEITVNFRRGGHFTRMLNQFVPFLNANVQGVGNFGRFYKSFASAKKWKDGSNIVKLAPAAAAITTAEIASYQFHKDKTWYKALPEYEKDLFWFVEGDKGTVYRIPKPFEWGWAFGTQFRKFAENGMGKKGFNAWSKSAVKTFFPQTLMPTAVEMPITLATNYDFFRDQYLTSPFKLTGDKRLQYNKWTPELYKKASAYFGGVSPVQIEYFINTLSGGMAREGQKMYGTVDRWIHGAGDYNAFQRSGANVGFAGRFLVRRGTPQQQVKIWDRMKTLEGDRKLSGNPRTFDRTRNGRILKRIKRWHATRGKALRARIEKEGDWETAVKLWDRLAREADRTLKLAESADRD